MDGAAQWRPGRPATGAADRLPLPVLPLTPAVTDYPALQRAVRDLRLRHVAEVLRPPQPTGGAVAPPVGQGGFRVLDGLWLPGRGHALWVPVDTAFLDQAARLWRDSGDERAPAAGALLRTLRRVHRDDPMGLRRLVLYQLCCLLADAEGGPTADAAEALGVHPDEAAPLAAAVAARFFDRSQRSARRAAEEVVAAWRGGRLRRAARLASSLPARPADHVLAEVLTAVHDGVEEVARLLRQAERLTERGQVPEAGEALLTAAWRASDDPEVRTALLAHAAHAADTPDTADAPGGVRLDARVTGDTVRLRWPAPTGQPPPRYAVVRFPDGAPEQAVDLPVPEDGTRLLDTEPPTGRPLRYALVPLRDGRPAGPPTATAPLLVVPEVSDVTAGPVPGGVRLRWRAHPGATAVRAVRWTADEAGGAPEPVACALDGLVDRPLPPGEVRYVLSCGYPAEDGRLRWSPGLPVRARAVEWPAVVGELTLRGVDDNGRLVVDWSAPARGEARVVPWRGAPVAVGEDVSALLPYLPPGLPATATGLTADGTGGDATAVTDLAPGTALRLTAVSVLGERAVAGASVVVEAPGVVTGLTARRLDRDPTTAAVTFDWPEPVVLVRLTWPGPDGRPRHRHLSRSRHRGTPAYLPVPREGCHVTVTPVTRPDADLTVAGVGVATLPPLPPLPSRWAHAARAWARQPRPRWRRLLGWLPFLRSRS